MPTILDRPTPSPREEKPQKSPEEFQKEYLAKLGEEYQKTIATFGDDARTEKERLITDVFNALRSRLTTRGDFSFSDLEQTILKLKLARWFQHNDSIDTNTLFDALIETPKFIKDDKGSLYRLLEIHEEKTIQKIAEMRKKRAELGDKEASNPWENLFMTKSGKYYMARLLNMPHLEKESEYMNHCVGTSDSYLNRMKRGEIEILSFRNVPEINPKTHKLEGDTPLITIEYNIKTNTIEQMKKQNDAYLDPSDPYFADVLDALKQLRETTTDIGKPRDFTKIAPSELENIDVKDYHLITEQGEVNFHEYTPEIHGFILKAGKMEITSQTSKDDAVKMLKIVEHIEVRPEEIAYGPEEVMETTKVYIGSLIHEDNEGNLLKIFEKLRDVLHIYTSFPEKKIHRESVEVGGKSVDQLISEMEAAGIIVSDHAKSMLNNEEFKKSLYTNTDAPRAQWILKKREQETLIRLTVSNLGFKTSATTDQIFERAKALGLELCPPDIGPNYSLKYRNQPLNEWIYVGMKQISDFVGNPYVFRLECYGDDLWLLGSWALPDGDWDPGGVFVFRLRKSES